MSNPQIHIQFLSHRYLFLKSKSFFQILKSMAVSHFLKYTYNDITMP
jgi:hypothetical protein